jgi:hypothetical protein
MVKKFEEHQVGVKENQVKTKKVFFALHYKTLYAITLAVNF